MAASNADPAASWRLQLVDFGSIGRSGGDLLRRKPSGEAIDHFAHLIKLHDAEGIERHDAQPLAAGFLDQALALQQMQGVADRLAGDAQHVGQFGLADPLAGQQRAVRNRLQHLLIGAIDQALGGGKCLQHGIRNSKRHAGLIVCGVVADVNTRCCCPRPGRA